VSAKGKAKGHDEGSEVKAKRHWNMPNWNAQARLLAGGDLRAAFLLIRIVQVWKGTKRKLRRCGREWVAMPGEDWQQSGGLTESECNNYAIPLLKANCAGFLTFAAMKLRHEDRAKLLWVSIDEDAMKEQFQIVDEMSLTMESKEYVEPLKGVGYEYEMDEDGKPAKLGYYCLAKLTASQLNRQRKKKPLQGQPWQTEAEEDTTS
jgi:hypothetical protein